MSLRSKVADVRRALLCACYRRVIPLGNQGPIISFTFDDFPRSAFFTGGAILEKFGARGTYYAALGLANTTNELGELLHRDDLHSLVGKGHELGSQTFNHLSCRSVSLPAFREDLRKGRKVLEDAVGVPAENFSYPFGHVSLTAKRTSALEQTSFRSIVPGFNGPEIDLNLLRANSLYGGIDQVRRAEELILENANRKTWLIFYTHDVRPNPSIYGCEPALLESTVSFAACSGARILTIRKALAEMGLGSCGAETGVLQRVHAD